MRYINQQKVIDALPPGWPEKARQALLAVANASESERSSVIERYSSIWRDLKSILEDIAHKKCWYCETNLDRSDNAVDHYRPKNAVYGTDHPGYWWLAFEIRNYCFSCTFCNSRRNSESTSGGKHDNFPLYQESKRAWSKEDDLDEEQPLLLSPFSHSDVNFLWFDEDGQPTHNPICCEEDSYSYKKIEKSIELYHLDHPDTVERRLDLARRIKDKLEIAEKFLDKVNNGNTTAQQALDQNIAELKEMLEEKSEFSRFSETIIKGLRGNYNVADMI